MTEQKKPISEMKFEPNQVLEVRQQLKDKLKAERDAYELKEADIKEKIAKLEDWLSYHLVNTMGAESARFGNRTVVRVLKHEVRVKDWHEFHKFVQEQGNLTLLQKRAAQREVLKLMEQNDNEPPPGVHIEARYELQVRTNTSKK